MGWRRADRRKARTEGVLSPEVLRRYRKVLFTVSRAGDGLVAIQTATRK